MGEKKKEVVKEKKKEKEPPPKKKDPPPKKKKEPPPRKKEEPPPPKMEKEPPPVTLGTTGGMEEFSESDPKWNWCCCGIRKGLLPIWLLQILLNLLVAGAGSLACYFTYGGEEALVLLTVIQVALTAGVAPGVVGMCKGEKGVFCVSLHIFFSALFPVSAVLHALTILSFVATGEVESEYFCMRRKGETETECLVKPMLYLAGFLILLLVVPLTALFLSVVKYVQFFRAKKRHQVLEELRAGKT